MLLRPRCNAVASYVVYDTTLAQGEPPLENPPWRTPLGEPPLENPMPPMRHEIGGFKCPASGSFFKPKSPPYITKGNVRFKTQSRRIIAIG